MLLRLVQSALRLIGMRLGLLRQAAPAAPSIEFRHPTEDLTQLTLGQLYQASINIDVLLTAGYQSGITANDREYLLNRSRAIDAELTRRGYVPYALEP